MYDVARFVPRKQEDWDNGCGPTERDDLDAFRHERTHSMMGDVMRKHLFGRQTDATPSDSVCGKSAALIANNSITGAR